MMKLASRPIEINGDLHFSQYWDSEISQNFTHCLHCLKAIFQIRLLNEINFLLIIIYILLQFKVFIYSPLNF